MILKESMNEVFLGLGGNSGQRFKIFKEAVEAIQKQIGVVVLRSSIYETEPWGSNSNHLFLNQVIKINTKLNPKALLKEISDIEKQFGRIRTKNRNSDRTLDIDILFFNKEIIETKNIQIPHPRLHLRKFVLWPLAEIEKSLHHPILKKNISQLKKECDDGLRIKKMKSKKPLFICVEGNIGVGKTTIAKALSKKHKANYLGEIFEGNALLPLFYESPDKYAFALEWSLFLSRFNQLIQLNPNQSIVCDYSIYKSLWFASINLSKRDFLHFKKNFDTLLNKLPKPDLIIYLKTTSRNLSVNINKRGRTFEKRIKKVYLDQIDKVYENGFLSIKDIPFVKVEVNSYDSENPNKIIKTIENNIKEKFGKIQQNLYF